jgi:hypothetical protein
MTIVYLEYEMTPVEMAPGKFDLSKKVTRKKKESSDEYESTTDIAYGCTLGRCFEIILSLETSKRLKDKIITVKEYIDEFNLAKEELKIELNNKFKIKIN